MTQSALESMNTPEGAARLLKLLDYPHDEMVDALVSEYHVSRGEAERLLSDVTDS